MTTVKINKFLTLMLYKENIVMTRFRIEGRRDFLITGKFYGEHRGDRVKAKFSSKETHRVAGKIIGKIGGEIVASPGESLEKKLDKNKISHDKFNELAKKAFRKIKREAKNQGLPTGHMKLKVIYTPTLR